MLDSAVALAERGIPVFPVHTPKPDGSCSCNHADCQGIGKHPRTPAGLKDASTDLDQIRAWWRKWPRANVAMRTGAESGTFALDIDPRHGGDYDRLTATYGELPQTLTAITGSGGQHLVFQHPGFRVQNDAKGKVLGDGYDLRGDGGYIIVAPSLHVSGGRYAWVDATVKPAPAPQWLLDRIQAAQAASEPKRSTSASQDAPADRHDKARHWLDHYTHRASPGNRNDTGKDLCLQLRDDARLDQAEALGYMLDYASAVGLPAREVSATVRSIYKRDPREPARSQTRAAKVTPLRSVYQGAGEPSAESTPPATSWPLTDTGNAERLVAKHGDKLRYCAPWSKWLIWDGQRWKTDDYGRVMQLVKATVRGIHGEAEHEEDDKQRKAIAQHAIRSESAKARGAMEQLARSELPITPDELDADPWFLNVENGTLDLRTGRLREHSQADKITKLAPVAYDPAARCPTFLAWLSDVFQGNQALVTFLQRYIGYSLTGSTREHKFLVLHGTGRNGKSTLLELLRDLLGDYAMQTPADTLMAKQKGAIPNDVARLKGARLVSAVETEDGQRLAESLVKQMTGGDTMTARFMRAEWFDFRPVFKIWLATNHKPAIRGTDNAIWARIRLVPFNVSYLGREDTTLPERLRQELPGILAWAVRGCLDWQRDGLTEPAEVTAATEEYRHEMDSLGDFLADCCELHPTATVTNKRLRAAYEEWCETNGEQPLGSKTFSQRLAAHDGIKKADHLGEKQERGWAGLRLKMPSEDPAGTLGDSGTLGDTYFGINSSNRSHEAVISTQVSRSVPSVPAVCSEGGDHEPRKLPSGRIACRKCGEEVKA